MKSREQRIRHAHETRVDGANNAIRSGGHHTPPSTTIPCTVKAPNTHVTAVKIVSVLRGSNNDTRMGSKLVWNK